MMKNDHNKFAVELVNALDQLLTTIANALAEYETPQVSGSDTVNSYLKWKNTAQPLLMADRDKLKRSISSVTDGQNSNLIRSVAENEVGLAKNLDTFRMDFAGPRWAEHLDNDITRVIVTASRILQFDNT